MSNKIEQLERSLTINKRKAESLAIKARHNPEYQEDYNLTRAKVEQIEAILTRLYLHT